MNRMWIKFVGAWMILVLLWLLVPLTAGAASLEGITFATSYYNQPVSNSGGAALSARLPFGTLPSPFEAVAGWKLIPQALEDRLYYSVGGRFNSQGSGTQPPDGFLLVGLGYKLHPLLGASVGLSRFESRGEVSNVTYWSVDLDVRGLGAMIERLAGP